MMSDTNSVASENSKSGGLPFRLSERRTKAFKKRSKAAKREANVTLLTGSTVAAALRGEGEYDGWAGAAVLLLVIGD